MDGVCRPCGNERTKTMQYWKPDAPDEFAGDMMPYWDGKRFHLFYLLDREHHAEQDGLGGHQWAHCSTEDLIHWTHHPLALPIGEPGTADQHGICTGSIFEWEGVYHAFYATRIKRPDGSVYEAICRAAGSTLDYFDKSPDNPILTAGEGLDPRNLRDPFVFRDPETGRFHMLVTAAKERGTTPETQKERGVLAHYVSENLDDWQSAEPILTLDDSAPTPECPEHFYWNGFWYLLYSQKAEMTYWVSEKPLGPWRRARRETIEGSNLSVPRTAAFRENRRIAVGFLPWQQGDRDAGSWAYAGNAIFRELIQDPDGTLFTKFVPEMLPRTGPPLAWEWRSDTASVAEQSGAKRIEAEKSGVSIADVPPDCLLSVCLNLLGGANEYGLTLRSGAANDTGYALHFFPGENRVELKRPSDSGDISLAVIENVEGLDQPVNVVICMKDSIIDVCVNGQRTMVIRCFDHRGSVLRFFATSGQLDISELQIAPLI